MEAERIGINKIKIELSCAEADELVFILHCGIDHLEEYNDIHFLKAHDADWWKVTIKCLGLLSYMSK